MSKKEKFLIGLTLMSLERMIEKYKGKIKKAREGIRACRKRLAELGG